MSPRGTGSGGEMGLEQVEIPIPFGEEITRSADAGQRDPRVVDVIAGDDRRNHAFLEFERDDGEGVHGGPLRRGARRRGSHCRGR